MFNVRDYGAVGDGLADDSAAVQATIINAKNQNAAVFFPAGKYRIPALAAQSGHIVLVGFGDATLIGSVSYSAYVDYFVPSADTTMPPTEDSPFFSATGLNFKAVTEAYALTVTAQPQDMFLVTAQIQNCRFYGELGLKTENLIGFNIDGCWFHNTRTGWRAEGCTNGSITASKWHNQPSFGVLITSYDPDPSRKGGENLRFSNCEWAVCSYGLYVERHNWLTMDSCLLDYCGVPLTLRGSSFAKIITTYFGAANAPKARFFGLPTFTDIFPEGISVYGIPYVNASDETDIQAVGGRFANCEFVNYTGNDQPPVYFEGSAAFAYGQASLDNGQRADRIQFTSCLFLMPSEHRAETLLQISNAVVVGVFNNHFDAQMNAATTIQAAYRFNMCASARGTNNDFTFCRDASNQIVGSAYEG